MSDAIFTLDFANEGTLVGQLTDNIRRAIAMRMLKPGESLPSIVTGDCRDFVEAPGHSAGR